MTVYIVGLTLAVLSSVVTGKSPCCTVPKWEAILGFMNEWVVSGQGVVEEGRILLSYDRDNKMINLVFDEHQGDKHSKGRYLYDFKNKIQYTIDEQGTCRSNPLTDPMTSGCVPDGAKKVANYYYGSSDSPLNVNVYRLAMKGQNAYLTMAPTGTTCIPIAAVDFAVGSHIEATNYGFSNFTVGIKNTTVFDVPPQCKKIPFLLPIKNKIPKLKLGRY